MESDFLNLHSMRSTQLWFLVLVTGLALGGMGLFWSIEGNTDRAADPTNYAADRYIRWERPPVQLPVGLIFSDSTDDLTITAFYGAVDSLETVFHALLAPVEVPDAWGAIEWRGGWLMGTNTALNTWDETPDRMAARWFPRQDGRTVLERTVAGEFISRFYPQEPARGWTETTWLQDSVIISPWPLPETWVQGVWQATQPNSTMIEVKMGRWNPPESMQAEPWLDDAWNGTWATVQWETGALLSIYGWADSTGLWGSGEGEFHGDGYYEWKDGRRPMNAEVFGHSNENFSFDGVPELDAVIWTPSSFRIGRLEGNHRVTWQVESVDWDETFITQAATEVESPPPMEEFPLALVRNHRTGEKMALVWDPPLLKALSTKGEKVWDLELGSVVTPELQEVDLYRNGKFQVAVANDATFHVIDVLGREVKGFPKRPNSGITASAVVDYDRNRNYRFLLGTMDGRILNYKEEGISTSGWNFQKLTDRYVVALAHLRVGNKDFIYAGLDDGKIKLLKRSGADRYQTEVRMPPHQKPAFRLGQSISSSTVLYVDEAGWVQERTFGTNEAVGMSRMTRGQSVKTEDRDGDGFPEVIVQTPSGEEIWNSRNEKINL